MDYFEEEKHPKISEYSYNAANIENVGFRLLGIFRYWNIIQYYFPYKYMLSEKLGETIRDIHNSFSKCIKLQRVGCEIS